MADMDKHEEVLKKSSSVNARRRREALDYAIRAGIPDSRLISRAKEIEAYLRGDANA